MASASAMSLGVLASASTMNLGLGRDPIELRLEPRPRAEAKAVVGTIVIAHGGDSVWNSHVIEAARAARTGGPVEVSFLMGPAAKTTRFQDAVARLEKAGVREIVVVPMLVSSHSGHYDQIRYLAGDSVKLGATMEHHLHMSGIERPVTRVPMRLVPALDAAPQLARVLTDRARALASNPSARALMIVGHGPNSAEDYAAWMQNLRVVADSVKALSGFRDVRVELVRDDAPAPVRAEAVRRTRELIGMQRMITGQDVVVVPVLISKGSVSRDKLPRDLAGMPIVYSGEPLLPHAEMVRWIEASVLAARPSTFGP
jgi:sirohydrochlorin cobaltochelatase